MALHEITVMQLEHSQQYSTHSRFTRALAGTCKQWSQAVEAAKAVLASGAQSTVSARQCTLTRDHSTHATASAQCESTSTQAQCSLNRYTINYQ
eukprot:2153-Heterococcus_DN1.PRE.5